MIRRRDLWVACGSVALTLAGVGVVAKLGSAEASHRVLDSRVFDWKAIQGHATDVGEYRQYVRQPTRTLDELEIHVTRLNPGQTSHAPHRHANEELIVLKEGTLETLVNGRNKVRLGPGSVIFNASNQVHAVRNVGKVPAVYHVINWSSPGTSASSKPSKTATNPTPKNAAVPALDATQK